ncbi:MAG: APC family permease [Bryobacteraceae bacterium]|nr:APC family permease [Bryobacteraceae bacterium]
MDKVKLAAPGPDAEQAAPHFRRVLSRRDLVLYGLVILTPTAPYPVFGIVQQLSGGHAALAYVVAMVAMFFTAASYAKMSAVFPSAGSTYTYAQRGLNPHAGFLAGWAMILDYFLIPLLSVIYASLTAERLLPIVPNWIWAILFTLAITAVNLRGIRMTARASAWLMGIMTGCAILFTTLAIRHVAVTHGWAGLFSLPGFFRPESFSPGPMLAAAGVATLSYIGFDAISTLAEDAVDPKRDIGWATVAVCIFQGLICILTVYLAALVWPDYKAFPSTDTAILDIASLIGGKLMFGALTFVLLVAGLASALTGQAGASRLLLGMGRDGIISSRVFAKIDPRTSTPVRGILVMGAVALIGSLAFRFQLAVELLNFGALTGFIMVNLAVIAHYYFRLRLRSGWDGVRHLLFPILGAVVCGFLWLNLSNMAKLAGFGWLAVGFIYLAILTRGFRIPPKTLASLEEDSSNAG